MKRLLLFILLIAPVAAQAQPVPSPFGIDPRTLMAPITFPASAVNGGGVSTVPILLPDGTATSPSLAFTSQPAFGLRRAGSGVISFTDGLGGNGGGWIASSGFSVSSGRAYNFTSSADGATGSIDTQILRAAAGELSYTTVVFSALGTPANGTQALCTDCAPTTPASCPATKASCVCTGGGVGSLAIRVNATWYCPF